MKDQNALIAAVDRLRMQSDGQGVTTLVCFQGCPLRCKLCINPFTRSDRNDCARQMTPADLYETVKTDELYFLATGGGVTFGGGEPLLCPDFIREFRTLCGSAWHLCAETSLAVPWENVEAAAEVVDVFYIDCKDTDLCIYKRYTGKDNTQMLENVKRISQIVSPERIVMRIPLIPGFNTEADQQKSKALFSQMGLTQFDLFTYREPV